MAMSIDFIEEEIKKAIAGSNTPQNIRDYALLCIARDNLRDLLTPKQEKKPIATLDDIESALQQITCSTETERRRAMDAATWARIIRGE